MYYSYYSENKTLFHSANSLQKVYGMETQEGGYVHL